MEQQPDQQTQTEGALGFCRSCGRSVPPGQGRPWQGALHCMDCIVKLSHESPEAGAAWDQPEAAQSRSGSPYTSPSVAPPVTPMVGRSPSPILAVILGLIPGVGAVYNGQYAKGILHVVVFGGLISALASGAADGAEPIFGMLIALMFFYMPLEAFRTARGMERGEDVDEFSGLLPAGHSTGRSPAAGIVLIALGVVFLLQSLGLLYLRDLVRFWPVSLIAIGAYLLYRRVAEGEERQGRELPGSGWRNDRSQPWPGRGSHRTQDLPHQEGNQGQDPRAEGGA